MRLSFPALVLLLTKHVTPGVYVRLMSSTQETPSVPEPRSNPVVFDDLSNERLEAVLCDFSTRIAASTCSFLLAIAEFDARQAWGSWGARSSSHWLTWQCGLAPSTAREYVRVARVLVDYPQVIELFSQGSLSYAKVRTITRVLTPDNADILVNYARYGTPEQLNRIVHTGEAALVDHHDAEPVFDPPTPWRTRYDGTYQLTIVVTADHRAQLESGLQSLLGDEFREDDSISIATGVVAMAQTIERPTSLSPSETHITVDYATLRDDTPGLCEANDQAISPEKARRLSCDGSIAFTLLSQAGEVVGHTMRSRPQLLST